jgi:hypothetical protein
MSIIYRFELGSFRYTVVLDGHFPYPQPGLTMLTNAPDI